MSLCRHIAATSTVPVILLTARVEETDRIVGLEMGERSLVDRDGVSVPLSTGEYNLLHALVTRPRQVLTRDQLLDLTQGREAAAFDRAIDDQVSRLRRKIEGDPGNPEIIKTVCGGGYMLATEVKRL